MATGKTDRFLRANFVNDVLPMDVVACAVKAAGDNELRGGCIASWPQSFLQIFGSYYSYLVQRCTGDDIEFFTLVRYRELSTLGY